MRHQWEDQDHGLTHIRERTQGLGKRNSNTGGYAKADTRPKGIRLNRTAAR